MEISQGFSSLQIEESNMEAEPANSIEKAGTLPSDETGPSGRPRRSCSYRLRSVLEHATMKTVGSNNQTAGTKVIERLQNILDSDQKIRSFYTNVNKNWRTKHTNLETIFEEPKETKDGSEMTMSKARLRRSLVFNTNRVTKARREKRKKAIAKNKSDVTKAKIAKSGL